MPAPSSSTSAVFLSYASQDAEAAARICEALRAAGVDVWLDQSDLRGGDAWDAQIKKQIHECALFIPVISAHTNARTEGYFRREWNLATRRLLDMAHDCGFPGASGDRRDPRSRCARPRGIPARAWTRLPGGETPPAFAHRVRQLLDADAPGRGRPELSRQARCGTAGSRCHRGTTGVHAKLTAAPRLAALAIACIAAAVLAFGWAVREWAARDDPRPSDESSARHRPNCLRAASPCSPSRIAAVRRAPASSPREFRKRSCISSASCRG